MGRPPKEINWDAAEELAKIQCTEEEICNVLDVDDKTLTKHIKLKYDLTFSEWYKKYSSDGKASLRRRLFDAAHDNSLKGSIAAAIWLSKNYLGMKDNIEHDVTDKTFKLAYSIGK